MNTIPSDWTPTTPNINALPDPIRHYIHQLETRTDPAGDVRRIAELKDQVEALQMLLGQARQSLRDQYALAWLPHAINDAIKGYGHVCPTVIERAQSIAYEAADAMMKARDQ